jgi:hypothetical protein
MLRTNLAFALILFCFGSAFAQQSAGRNEAQSKQPPASSTCDISEVYRGDGWTVPGLKGATAISKRGESPNMPGVFTTFLRPSDSQSMFAYYLCSKDHSGRLEIMEFPIGIARLISFDIGGRVFAYYIHFGREYFNEDGERRDAGTESDAIFYDLDGSGRFTLRRWSKLPIPEFVPDWVRKQSSSSSTPLRN